MKLSKATGFMLAGILVLISASHASPQEARHPELPNFHQVNPQLYRGAQPKSGGLEKLKAMGIKTIVNLRGVGEVTEDEGASARALGFRYYNVPMPEFSKPSDSQVRQALDLINAADNQPVFVHCRHGQDRTGTIVACYRITHDGWTAAAAKKEAASLGMSWTQVGMKKYIDKFYKQRHQRERSGQSEDRSESSNLFGSFRVDSWIDFGRPQNDPRNLTNDSHKPGSFSLAPGRKSNSDLQRILSVNVQRKST